MSAIDLPHLTVSSSPNFNARGGTPVDLVVVHDCEGSFSGAVSWFGDPRSKVSSHYVLDEAGANVVQMVSPLNRAWHACNFNSRSIGLEMAGISSKGFGASEWQAAAGVVAFLLKQRGIPPLWARHGAGPGFTSHYDLGAAGGGHSDPTTDTQTWLQFVGLVQFAYGEDMPAGFPIAPLPQLPPSPPPTFAPHTSTLHGFAVGSIEWVQAELNASQPNLSPMPVDGMDGPATSLAIRVFQTAAGLKPDGIAGPLTIAAIQKGLAA